MVVQDELTSDASRHVAAAELWHSLVIEHMDHARAAAWKQWRRIGHLADIEELTAIAYLGLVKAARIYDESRGVAFTTLLYTVIERDFFLSRIRFMRERGWRWTTRDGDNRAEQVAKRVLWPVDEDGNRLEIGSIESDPVQDIAAKRRLRRLFQAVRNERDMAVLTAQLSGDGLAEVSNRFGMSRQRAHQLWRGLHRRADEATNAGVTHD